MRRTMRDFPVTLEEVRDMMKKEEAKRCGLVVAAISVVAVLVGIIIWISKKREKDLEEQYEYFDDDFDELDEDYDDFDDSIYDDEDEDDEQIEYVKIQDFVNDDEEHTEAEAKEEKEDEQ